MAYRPDDPPYEPDACITTISATRPLAHRAHTCTVCGLPIAIGTRYERTIYRDDDALDRKHNLRVIKWHLPLCPAPAAEGPSDV